MFNSLSTFVVFSEEQQLATRNVSDQPVVMDSVGQTEPSGPKIYAIRRSPDGKRVPSVYFNWTDAQSAGFRRAGDNASSFVLKTYPSLRTAFTAAVKFSNEPPMAERGVDPAELGPVWDGRLVSFLPWLYASFWFMVSRLGASSKLVLMCLTLSGFLFIAYNSILFLEVYVGCAAQPKNTFGSSFNGLNPVCSNLTDLKNHVQKNSVQYVDMFFAQLKIAFVLVTKYIIDEMFK